MKSLGSNSAWRWAWLGAVVCGSAMAEPRLAEEPRPIEPAVAEPPLRWSTGGMPADWRSRAALDLKRPEAKTSLGLSIVELPAEGVPGARTRPRHALSIQSEAPQRMLRSIGIEATDCATRFRMPTKLQRDATGGSSIEVRATLGLACRF